MLNSQEMQLASVFRISTNFSTNVASIMTDHYSATLDFVYKYSLAIFESATQAVSSVLDLSSSSTQEVQYAIRTVFNSTLDRRLNEDSFASSLAAALNSWTE